MDSHHRQLAGAQCQTPSNQHSTTRQCSAIVYFCLCRRPFLSCVYIPDWLGMVCQHCLFLSLSWPILVLCVYPGLARHQCNPTSKDFQTLRGTIPTEKAIPEQKSPKLEVIEEKSNEEGDPRAEKMNAAHRSKINTRSASI